MNACCLDMLQWGSCAWPQLTKAEMSRPSVCRAPNMPTTPESVHRQSELVAQQVGHQGRRRACWCRR
jgi:hypothetical protein